MKTPGQEIAARIEAHLRVFERDREVNVVRRGRRTFNTPRAVALEGPERVTVQYHAARLIYTLTLHNARQYLAWLDAGYKGAHWDLPSGGIALKIEGGQPRLVVKPK